MTYPNTPRLSRLLTVVRGYSRKFPAGFEEWLVENCHVYDAFEREAQSIAERREHYSARTIIEYLRHHTLLAAAGDGWKLDNDMAPGLARLFAAVHPRHANLFEFRERRVSPPTREAA
jgi:hypothetical protein